MAVRGGSPATSIHQSNVRRHSTASLHPPNARTLAANCSVQSALLALRRFNRSKRVTTGTRAPTRSKAELPDD